MESVSYTPDRLPLDDDDYIVIAPFWADVDIEIGGEIYYRESTDLSCFNELPETSGASILT